MPLSTGAVTCRAYTVAEPPQGDFLSGLARDLQRHAFQPVQAARGQMRSIGWVNPRNILDIKLSPEKVRFEDYVVLGMRVDKVTVNARLLKAHYAEEATRVLREHRKKVLGREERAALLEKVRLELAARQTPSTSLYEMAWNVRTHRVYFSATSQALNLEFCDLFSDTFHAGLTPLFPFLRAERKCKSEGRPEVLAEALPAQFCPTAALARLQDTRACQPETRTGQKPPSTPAPF
ncbi:recombination-associated protein RdgC [Candidatus Sumerlaeota bacterium]|nr:recombination-associated protein RdgC [Candidatus Sumerlaeota bacterium]